MSRLEIIHLRMSGGSSVVLERQITQSIKGEADDAGIVTIYRQDGLESDMAIHIRHPEAKGEHRPGPLGVRLAAALRDYGLVEHTVWEELT